MFRLFIAVALAVVSTLNFSFSDAIKNDGPKLYFYYHSPLHPTIYQVVKGSLTGIQKAFDDHNHDTIAKDEKFTVLVTFSSPLYNEERQWYEFPARFCYGKDIEGCVNETRSFSSPYLVRPTSTEIPVPFVVPFSKVFNATLRDGKTVFEAGIVHEQFKTFEVNGAKYDTSTGILKSFTAESPVKAGKISGIDFSRRKELKDQPLIQCHFVEWTADGCVPGLGNVMIGYDVKFLKLKNRRWLKPVKFPNHKDKRYLRTLYIPGIGKKTYLVFKGMALERETLNRKPFVHVFSSVEEQVNETLKSVGLSLGKGSLLGSGRYQSFSKHYEKEQSYSAAMSGTEFRFFRATMPISYLEDEANWDDGFKTRWKSMFDQRNKENAMDFFREYGTHFVVQAVMGGRQETVFTINYCEVSKEKSTKLDFEANLLKPYKFPSSGVGIQAQYNYMRSRSLVKIIISGPQTTCTGGNSLDSEVCYNLTLWKSSILINPYPIEMTLKPFYTLVKGYEDRQWMEKRYEEYLKANLDEVKIDSVINLKAKCERNHLSGDTGKGVIVDIVVGLIAVVVMVIFIGCSVLRDQPNAGHEGG